jgi:hypothetical protein
VYGLLAVGAGRRMSADDRLASLVMLPSCVCCNESVRHFVPDTRPLSCVASYSTLDRIEPTSQHGGFFCRATLASSCADAGRLFTDGLRSIFAFLPWREMRMTCNRVCVHWVRTVRLVRRPVQLVIGGVQDRLIDRNPPHSCNRLVNFDDWSDCNYLWHLHPQRVNSIVLCCVNYRPSNPSPFARPFRLVCCLIRHLTSPSFVTCRHWNSTSDTADSIRRIPDQTMAHA